MGQISREQQDWLIEPLVAAGLGPEEIRSLVFRLGFEAIVCADRGTTSGVQQLVGDQPVHVQVAWTQMVDRMVILGERAGWATRGTATS